MPFHMRSAARTRWGPKTPDSTTRVVTYPRRIVKDRIRLWKQGVRDLVMEICCALYNFRVRLTPWQPMV